MAKKSDDSDVLGLEVRLEKGCMSKAEVAQLGQIEYSADRRCWVGRKIEETRQATEGRTKTLFSRVERGVSSPFQFPI